MVELSIGQRSKELLSGVVRKWCGERGYGFIDSGADTYFVHITKVVGEKHLNVNDRVSFSTLVTTKGVQAIDVQVLSTGEPKIGRKRETTRDAQL